MPDDSSAILRLREKPSSLSGSERYPLLFSPLKVGTQMVRNRICHASMTTRYSVGSMITDRWRDYFVERAAGGCGMIVCEPFNMTPRQNAPQKVTVWDDRNNDRLAEVAEGIAAHGCLMLAQVQDPGRGMHHKGRRPNAVSASALPDDLSWSVGHAMNAEEIREMIRGFAESCRKLQKLGWHGAEISCGHGHLFHQFMSPIANIRDDEFGGSLENRLRFITELIAAIRDACGADFIIGLKLPSDDGQPGSIGPAEAAEITAKFTADHARDFDYFCFAKGWHGWSLVDHIPDMTWDRMPYNELTKSLKQQAGDIPVMMLGKIIEPSQAEDALAEGVGELVGLGRTLVTEAGWGLKAQAGLEHEARWCVSCNNCWGAITEKTPLACDNNPRCGTPGEASWRPEPAAETKKIAVIGGGPAGMEAAWVAAARGHQVTVYTSGSEYGGKTQLYSKLPLSEQVSSVFDYQIVALERHGGKVELGVTMTAEDILKLDVDTVILATGATMRWPESIPAEFKDEGIIPDLRETAAMLLQGYPPQPGVAVIYDHDHTHGTYATAELAKGIFDRVIIATPREMIAKDEPLVTQQQIYRRMHQLGIDIELLVEPDDLEELIEGRLSLRNIFSGQKKWIDEVALFTYATNRVPNDTLYAPLKQAGLEVHLIGDAYSPRYLIGATQHGHQIGNVI